MPSNHVKRGFLKWLTQGLLVFVLTFLSVYTPELKPEQRQANITETRVTLTPSVRRTIPYRIFLDRVGAHHINCPAIYMHVAVQIHCENKIRTRHRVTEREQYQMIPLIAFLPVVYSAETPDHLTAVS